MKTKTTLKDVHGEVFLLKRNGYDLFFIYAPETINGKSYYSVLPLSAIRKGGEYTAFSYNMKKVLHLPANTSVFRCK